MNEQIMKILPEKKICRCPIIDGKPWCDCWAEVHNKCVDDCAAAIAKANLVRCPTENAIKETIYNLYFEGSISQHDINNIAKALLALLRGER